MIPMPRRAARSRRDVHRPVSAERQVVLADLVALRQIRIEVVLPIPAARAGDLAAQRHADHRGHLDRAAVHDRKRARQPRDDRIDERVGLGVLELRARWVRRAAEHLRSGREFDVDLETHDQPRRADAWSRGGGHGSIIRLPAPAPIERCASSREFASSIQHSGRTSRPIGGSIHHSVGARRCPRRTRASRPTS